MRICQVMLAKGFGGAERYFVDLCRALAARRHEVLAICHPAGLAARALTGAPGHQWYGIDVSIWQIPPELQRKYPQYYIAEDLRQNNELFPGGESR